MPARASSSSPLAPVTSACLRSQRYVSLPYPRPERVPDLVSPSVGDLQDPVLERDGRHQVESRRLGDVAEQSRAGARRVGEDRDPVLVDEVALDERLPEADAAV